MNLNSYKLILPGTLPGLNKYIDALNVSKFRGNMLKKDAEWKISKCIKQQLKDVHIDKPVTIHYTHYLKDRKQDFDNIASTCMKFTQDALVSCGVLKNDTQQRVTGFTHEFFVDSANPRIEITLSEVET